MPKRRGISGSWAAGRGRHSAKGGQQRLGRIRHEQVLASGGGQQRRQTVQFGVGFAVLVAAGPLSAESGGCPKSADRVGQRVTRLLQVPVRIS